MDIPDFADIFISLNATFPVLVQLLLVIMGLVAFVLTLQALIGMYGVANDPTYGSQFYNGSRGSPAAHLGRLIIAGCLAVPAIVLWRAADTFVLGGSETEDLLTYLPGDGSEPYCDQLRFAITGFFMVLGVIAIFYAFMIANARVDGRGTASWGQALTYLIGGTICFFLNDVSIIISNTVGFAVGLEQVCDLLT